VCLDRVGLLLRRCVSCAVLACVFVFGYGVCVYCCVFVCTVGFGVMGFRPYLVLCDWLRPCAILVESVCFVVMVVAVWLLLLRMIGKFVCTGFGICDYVCVVFGIEFVAL